ARVAVAPATLTASNEPTYCADVGASAPGAADWSLPTPSRHQPIIHIMSPAHMSSSIASSAMTRATAGDSIRATTIAAHTFVTRFLAAVIHTSTAHGYGKRGGV